MRNMHTNRYSLCNRPYPAIVLSLMIYTAKNMPTLDSIYMYKGS